MDFDAGFVDTDGGEISVPAPVKAAMAGKFMSPEEAARLLGISVDEVNRLVDRKQLFPMRDGATNKFKTDDVEPSARNPAPGAGAGNSISIFRSSSSTTPPPEALAKRPMTTN